MNVQLLLVRPHRWRRRPDAVEMALQISPASKLAEEDLLRVPRRRRERARAWWCSCVAERHDGRVAVAERPTPRLAAQRRAEAPCQNAQQRC